MQKIIRNAIKCKLCGTVAESTDLHGLVMCACGACGADGGHAYLRRCYKDKDCFAELSETVEISEAEAAAEADARLRRQADEPA